MTSIEKARDVFQSRYEEEVSEYVDAMMDDVTADSNGAVDEITVDVETDVELSNELIALRGAVKALEVVDVPDTRLDSVLDGVCPHCYCTLQSFDVSGLEPTQPIASSQPFEMTVYCTQGHETKFYDKKDYEQVRRDASEIFVGADG